MAAFSDYAENAVLDHVLGTTALTSPTDVYVALFTSDPTDADSGTEVSGGSYARQTMAFNAAASGAADNSADVTFPTATASWGTVTHTGLYDASTSGNLLLHGALGTSKTIDSGDTIKFAAGDYDVTLD